MSKGLILMKGFQTETLTRSTEILLSCSSIKKKDVISSICVLLMPKIPILKCNEFALLPVESVVLGMRQEAKQRTMLFQTNCLECFIPWI